MAAREQAIIQDKVAQLFRGIKTDDEAMTLGAITTLLTAALTDLNRIADALEREIKDDLE